MVKEVLAMKKALGMIIRSLETDAELGGFIDNAKKYGHKLDAVIVAYTHRISPTAEKKLNEKAPFYAININNPQYIRSQFRNMGISEDTAETLLKCPIDTTGGLVPYGYNRNLVLMEALLREMDILFFADSDVFPVVLKKKDGRLITQEMDFLGEHLKHLTTGAEVTTGEYSGYNILPHAKFDDMDALLQGLQKSEMLDYWKSSETHRCLTIQSEDRAAQESSKILGGNCAFRLSEFSRLPPFFSTHYIHNDEMFLGRGEDTVLGAEISKNGITCMDIKLNPLHDTYKNYPLEPDLLGDRTAQERLYYACTGWVGRNPFLNYLLGNSLKETREYQRERLVPGLRALSQYTKNQKFNNVIGNFDTSWDNVNRYISEYQRVLEAWGEFCQIIDSGYQ